MDDPLHWPPGTPLLFAVARRLSGARDADIDPAAIYVAQWVVGMALVLAVFLLVRLITGPWPAVAAAAGVALYPPLAPSPGTSSPSRSERSPASWRSPASRGRGGRASRRRGASPWRVRWPGPRSSCAPIS